MVSERTQQHMYELNTESRLTKLESTQDLILKTLIEIKSDINIRFDKLDLRIDKLDLKIDKIDSSLNARIDKIDNRLWQIIFLISSSMIGLIIGKISHWF